MNSLQDGICLRMVDSIFNGHVLASDSSIVKDGDIYRMFYTDLDPITQKTIISQATYVDGNTWELASDDPYTPGVVVSGAPGSSVTSVEGAGAFHVGGNLIVLYSGYGDDGPATGFPAALYATSPTQNRSLDAIAPEPILEPTPGWYDSDAIYSPDIVETDDGYLMVYTGHAYFNVSSEFAGVRLLGATSTDGINWTKLEAPILSADPELDWMSGGVAEADIVEGPDGAYYLFFTGIDGEARSIGVARAEHPSGPWQVAPEPLLSASSEGFDGAQVLAPDVMVEDGVFKIYYLGVGEGETYGIGLAQSSEIMSLFADGDDTGGAVSVGIFGTDGDDALVGGAGNDELTGMEGDDTLLGGSGRDTLFGMEGGDILDGGEGIDTADYVHSTSGVSIDLDADFAAGGHAEGDSLDGIENLAGSRYADHFLGNDEDNVFIGRGGADTMFGGGDDDQLRGGSGSDGLFGGAGDDELRGGRGSDYIEGGDGNDVLIGGDGDGDGDDILIGGAGADEFHLTGANSDTYDVISDFNAHEGDKIVVEADINGSDVTTAADITNLFQFTVGANTHVLLADPAALYDPDAAQNWLIVENTTQLTSDNFLIA